jgi:hypothetical protein
LANLIEERVELARRGQNPFVICRMKSGWLVIGDVQPLPGYCVLLADPLVESVNALDEVGRTRCSLDTIRAGDAILAATGAYRINDETLCCRTELDEKRRRVAWNAYGWPSSRRFDPAQDGPFVESMRGRLA